MEIGVVVDLDVAVTTDRDRPRGGDLGEFAAVVNSRGHRAHALAALLLVASVPRATCTTTHT